AAAASTRSDVSLHNGFEGGRSYKVYEIDLVEQFCFAGRVVDMIQAQEGRFLVGRREFFVRKEPAIRLNGHDCSVVQSKLGWLNAPEVQLFQERR
ncbi:MAG TPA: hypothetical protein VGJ87_19585, partial [Roseiflexaceae bacterium]